MRRPARTEWNTRRKHGKVKEGLDRKPVDVITIKFQHECTYHRPCLLSRLPYKALDPLPQRLIWSLPGYIPSTSTVTWGYLGVLDSHSSNSLDATSELREPAATQPMCYVRLAWPNILEICSSINLTSPNSSFQASFAMFSFQEYKIPFRSNCYLSRSLYYRPCNIIPLWNTIAVRIDNTASDLEWSSNLTWRLTLWSALDTAAMNSWGVPWAEAALWRLLKI